LIPLLIPVEIFEENRGEFAIYRVGHLRHPALRFTVLCRAPRADYPCTWTTSNGKFHTDDVATMDLLFPEFSRVKSSAVLRT